MTDKPSRNFSRGWSAFQKFVSQSGPAASASYALLGSILFCTLLGYVIDTAYETSPYGVLIGMGIGLMAGFYHLAKTMWGGRK